MQMYDFLRERQGLELNFSCFYHYDAKEREGKLIKYKKANIFSLLNFLGCFSANARL